MATLIDLNIYREPVYYTADFAGMDVELSPLYIQALVFDGEKNEYGAQLISRLNKQLALSYSKYSLQPEPIKQLPQRILIINNASDQLPLAYETRRIWEAYINHKGWDCFTRIVNSRHKLLKETKNYPRQTLVFSQCGSKEIYDEQLCRELLEQGVVLIPGSLTANPASCHPVGGSGGLLLGGVNGRGLTAHYRLGVRGLVLESVYVREQSSRLPLNPMRVKAMGGETKLQKALHEGATEIIKLTEQSPMQDKNRIPLRLQVEFVPPDYSVKRISGDKARGLCLGTRWPDFIHHTLEWLKDGLGYYNYKRA